MFHNTNYTLDKGYILLHIVKVNCIPYSNAPMEIVSLTSEFYMSIRNN